MDSEDSVSFVDNVKGKYRLIKKQFKLFQWSCILGNATVANFVPLPAEQQEEQTPIVIPGKQQDS
jgi:hypothetical protein